MEHHLKHYVINPAGDWDGKAIVCLPGRGGSAKEMAERYAKEPFLATYKIIGIQPKKEWYPSPRGPKDQKEAVQGLAGMAVELSHYIGGMLREEFVTASDTVLVGYSAGGVMAIQTAAIATWTYRAIFVHNGCVLDPAILPERSLSVYLYHAKDDFCFDWNERYLPTKEALKKKGFWVNCIERESGGHALSDGDVANAARTIFNLFTPD
jgi:predicted esterase